MKLFRSVTRSNVRESRVEMDFVIHLGNLDASKIMPYVKKFLVVSRFPVETTPLLISAS